MAYSDEAQENKTAMYGPDAFSSYHPAVMLLYFVLTIGTAMFVLHPVITGISLAAAFFYAAYLSSIKKILFSIRYLLPAALFIVLINALFQHRGVTVLWYFPSGNPLTLESIIYGVATALMMLAVMLWFRSYCMIMTSEKFVYLAGRVVPVFALLLSMTLRFVPMCYEQFQRIREVQRSIGRDFSEGKILKRLHCAAVMFSMLFTWAAENAIITADSMKSRGYGLPGRTAFSIYHFEKRDGLLLCWFLICGGCLIMLGSGGWLNWTYYPMMNGRLGHPLSVLGYVSYAALCLTPLLLDRKEEKVWERCKSGI